MGVILMMTSFYNILLPTDGSKYFLFNALQRSLMIVDQDIKDLLESKALEEIPIEIAKKFKDNGILIEDDHNEQEVYHYYYESRKYINQEASFHIITTYACNFSCEYCFEGKGIIASQHMDLKTAENVMRFIKDTTMRNNCRALNIQLYGGETLINFDIGYKILENLSQWAREIHIPFSAHAITNGSLITEDIANKLSAFHGSVLVTLDGPREIHDRRRFYKDGRGTFDDIIKGLIIAKRHGLEITIRVNVNKENYLHIPSLLNTLKLNDLNKAIISIKPVFDASPACISCPSRDRDGESDKENIAICDNLYNTAREEGFNTDDATGLPNLNVCGALHSQRFIVDPLGRLFKCAILPPHESFSEGAIDESGMPKCNSLFYKIMSRNPLTIDDCGSCKLTPICGSGCLAMSLYKYGEPNKKVCEKNYMMERLKNCCEFETSKRLSTR